MALKGTLGDFALTDILQLIGLQRKTGTLVLRRGGEEIVLGFEEGAVVFAERRGRNLEQRVGQLLVRTGKLTEERLQEALEIQRETLQRLGHILVERGWIDRETLQAQLHLQITDTVYELFRWEDGEYDFLPSDTIEWDRELILPVSCDSLLMEGARRVDEWPRIQRVIPRPDIVLLPTSAAAELLADAADDGEVRGTVYDQDIDFGFIKDPLLDEQAEPGTRVGRAELRVLRWVDGERTAAEVAELSELGTFEAFKVLASLVERGLLTRAPELPRGGERAVPGWLRSAAMARLFAALAALLVLLGGISAGAELLRAFVPALPAAPLPRPLASAGWISRTCGLARARRATDRLRMEKIAEAARVFRLAHRRWPSSVEELVAGDLLLAPFARDPWGRPYRLARATGGLRVVAAGGETLLVAPPGTVAPAP